MEEGLQQRITKVRRRLWEGRAERKSLCISPVMHRVSKFKYKSKEFWKENSFLPKNLQFVKCLYQSNVDLAVEKFRGFQIHNPTVFLKWVEEVVIISRQGMFQWDAKWINPVILLSRGWKVVEVQECVITLRCACCCKSWLIELSDAAHEGGILELYNKRIQKEHGAKCPWLTSAVDIEQYYKLHKNNVSVDIQRIADALRSSSTLPLPNNIVITEDIKEIAKLFNADSRQLGLLHIFVKGYQIISDQIIECTRCFHRSPLQSLVDDINYHGHTTWCRYAEKNRLKTLLLELPKSGELLPVGTLSDRLMRLEKHLSIF
ncbi:Pml39p Ecym_2706 [Eremothecium cymbalariae DBVPG|uniref:C3HC-type domain-containing protein n=1 Tax=Eremothecium cymbalariae (strain CBS 270.75 / DBVPG 7215 / KCTC 17166 / NRRL Y-17582) TaxID=931890 RepID=G8JPE6_ERECY|nr:Hypothetical protein Ecym_2706 [Eremothecium cymbalariae DBVPG\